MSIPSARFNSGVKLYPGRCGGVGLHKTLLKYVPLLQPVKGGNEL